MGEASPKPSELSGPVEKIGVVHHYIRGAFIFLGLAVLVLIIWGTQRWSSAKNAEVPGFDAFRAAYAAKCGVASYAGAQPDVVNKTYVSSPPLRDLMAKQLAALNAGTNCFDVAKALKDVGFVVPKPGSEL